MSLNMVPPTIRRKLSSLRWRERLLSFVLGASCWIAVMLVLLAIACFIDWFIDRERDTPFEVRAALLFFQAAAAFIGLILFLLLPQIRRLSDATLALWVEDAMPQFDHRLISAVQFNQPGADLGGMSPELVEVVTREAEKQAQRVGFAQVADHRRLLLSVLVLAPVLCCVGLPVGIWPQLTLTLIARQSLAPIDVPHSVELTNASATVWPIGDEILIRYRVTGEFAEDMIGRVTVTPAGQNSDRYDLTFLKEDGDAAIFQAKVKASAADVRFSARLSDGRSRTSSTMTLVPRPVVQNDLAWIILPAYCDARPIKNKRRYEKPQPRGDVEGILGSSVRVQFEVERADHEAWLVLLENANADAKREDEGPSPERERPGKIKMAIKPAFKMVMKEDDETKEVRFEKREFLAAEAVFDLTPELTGYRMHVKSEHGFDNVPPKRRTLRVIPEEPPTVNLLRDTFGLGASASFDLEGMPVMVGEHIRIPYECKGPYGLGKAEVHYRVLKKHESGENPPEEEPWIRLPLPEVVPDEKAGPFDPKLGVFQNTAIDTQVPFHAMPSLNPETQLGRTQGGGLVFLDTAGLLDSKFKLLKLKSGDQVEYCIAVYASPRLPADSTPVARSESRVTTVLSKLAWEDWMKQVGREDERVRQLKLRQEGVFGPRTP